MNAKDVFAEARFAPEKMQKINLFETPNFFCDVYCLEPGQEQKPHAHVGADKIYYVLEGRGTFLVGDEESELGDRQIVLAPSGEPHGVRNTGDGRLTLLVVMSPNPNVK
ncbi:MAG TPA: cupin domain-containing protein [Blastocatellia bacterium]|nr:cupin domain-containing protein [Blastocatellia bacterium]